MPLHTAAYYGSLGPSAALIQVDALQTEFENVTNNAFVIGDLSQLILVYAYQANLLRVQLQEPVLQSPFYPDIIPANTTLPAPGAPAQIADLTTNPLQLKATEQLSAYASFGGTAAANCYIGVWFADKVPSPTPGKNRTIRGTGSTTLTANAWTSVVITLDDPLPAGKYSLVGMVAQSAGAILARIGSPGAAYRPGVVAVQNEHAPGFPIFRNGALGTWLTFNNYDQIIVDFLSSSADTAEVVYLDLVGPQ